MFSDDTSMTLATMESIIRNKTIDVEDMMVEFVYWLEYGKHTPDGFAFGVGGSTFNAIEKFYCGLPALRCGSGEEKGNGNGALMRMLPIVFYIHHKKINDDKLFEIVKNATIITHAHEINVMGVYMYVKYFLNLLNGYDKRESYEMLKKMDFSRFSKETIKKYRNILEKDISLFKRDEIKSGIYIVQTLESVLWCVLNSNDFKGAIEKAINLGGDTDTIAAITGGICGYLYGIPKLWIKKVKGYKQIEEKISLFEKVLMN